MCLWIDLDDCGGSFGEWLTYGFELTLGDFGVAFGDYVVTLSDFGMTLNSHWGYPGHRTPIAFRSHSDRIPIAVRSVSGIGNNQKRKTDVKNGSGTNKSTFAFGTIS